MEHVNAEILRAIADGKKVQYRLTAINIDGIQRSSWEGFDVKNVEACCNLLAPGTAEWRIAPTTIKIGDVEVQEPCREAPKVGQKFWTVSPFTGVVDFVWDGSKACHQALDGGFVHLTEEAAKQHYEAIKNLLEEK